MGSEHVERFTVEGDLATDVGGPLPQRVLSLAGMVVRIEPACATLASARLDTGATSVGAVVSLRDVGAVEGTQCETRASLSDGGDGRRLRFDVERPFHLYGCISLPRLSTLRTRIDGFSAFDADGV